MNRTIWTQAEIDILKEMYPDHFASEIASVIGRTKSQIYNKAQALGLKSTPEKISRSGRMSSNHPNVIASRFKKGCIPQNKGQKLSPEVYAKVARTMFKKGHRPVNHKEIGSERVNIYGYIEVKVAEPNKWKLKHRIIWEQVNGAIPKGHNVQFRNHDSLDCRIENLYLISKAEQIRTENSYHRYPKEIQELIHLKGVINRQIHKAERNGK